MRKIESLKIVLFLLASFCISRSALGQSSYFTDWPAGASPKEVGKRLAENFASRSLEFQSGKREFVIYPEACAWYGALNIAGETRDQDLTTRLVHKFDPLLTSDGSKHISQQAHVDYSVFGIIPLELYLQTKDKKYLEQANNIADFILTNSNLPADKIPYWDYNAPGIPNALTDASAAAVMASAFIELSRYVNKEQAKKYMAVAEIILSGLSSSKYKAVIGTNGGFILQHSVGSLPAHSEVDVPITYADYYFLEAMKRYKETR